MSRIQLSHTHHHIISLENLLAAWKEFVCGKRSRADLQEFERDLMTNIISLHNDLSAQTYVHSAYHHFRIADPKPRDIHKASVRDRLLHHALHRALALFFERTFIADSYSCQEGKGTHRALRRFRKFSLIASKNNTQTVWVLKCDIRKFFANINHEILFEILERYVPDKDVLQLIARIVTSFNAGVPGVGLPLGNLTSQLFVNIYMNEFDQFVKHWIKAKYYLRYADDFVVLSTDRKYLESVLHDMQDFLRHTLKLEMHPNKVSIQTVASGVDFLGWVHFPDHQVLRTVTKKRMFRNIKAKDGKEETVQSYLGLLQHGNSLKLQTEIERCVRGE